MMPQPRMIICFLVLAGISYVTSGEKTTVIVGAGLSGISAAAKLLENGFNDIVILEAENRIGGRVNSVRFADGFIDLGAQWVHGEKDNAIYETFSDHFQFNRPDEDVDFQYLLSSGQLANQDKCLEIDVWFKEVISVHTQNISLGALINQEFKKVFTTSESNDVSQDLAGQMLNLLEKRTNGYYSCESWFDVSILYNNLYSQDCIGNQILSWKKEGFKKVFDYITKKLPDPSKNLDIESKIQFNKEVTNVSWNPLQADGKITITCSDGSSYSTDHLIFTASLGVLKARHETLFTPSLPANKIKAIKNIAYGAIGKIFFEFEKPFWSVDDKGLLLYSLLWTHEDLETIKGTDREWLRDVVAVIKVDSYPNILEFFIAGSKLKNFEELTDDKLIDDVMWVLEKFLAKALPRPINIQRTRWLTSKNFLGSYSYLSMDSERTESTPKDLAESLLDTQGHPKILFAGEATHEKHSSFSNGAVESGWKAADELLTFLKS